jgi:hypothetical protein
MGMIGEPVGKVTVETRRESLVVHYDADWLREQKDDYAAGASHPEFAYEDIPDLIKALEQVRPEWEGAKT